MAVGLEYWLLAWVLPVGGGGTRVAPLSGPKGISGWLVAGAIEPAGANGPFAAVPIVFWHPPNKAAAMTDSNAVVLACVRVIAGL